MARTLLHTTPIHPSAYVLWGKAPLLNNQERVSSFLLGSLGREFEDFLAIPDIKNTSTGGVAIKWYTSLPGEITRLTDSGNELFNTRLKRIEGLITRLKTQSDKKEWADLLELIFKEVKPSQVYMVGERFCIADWGIKDGQLTDPPRPEEPNNIVQVEDPYSNQPDDPGEHPANNKKEDKSPNTESIKKEKEQEKHKGNGKKREGVILEKSKKNAKTDIHSVISHPSTGFCCQTVR